MRYIVIKHNGKPIDEATIFSHISYKDKENDSPTLHSASLTKEKMIAQYRLCEGFSEEEMETAIKNIEMCDFVEVEVREVVRFTPIDTKPKQTNIY